MANPTILRQYYCFLNTKKGPTADKNVRQAIAWAYDYEAHAPIPVPDEWRERMAA